VDHKTRNKYRKNYPHIIHIIHHTEKYTNTINAVINEHMTTKTETY